MTNQQAINILNGLEQSLDDYCELNDEGKAAFRMAITALELFGNSEQLPSAQLDAPDTNVGTTIYRQAAIDAMCESCSDWCDEGVCKKVSAIQKLQSARPTEASCWGCNCQKMEKLKEQKTFSEMVHLHDAERTEE